MTSPRSIWELMTAHTEGERTRQDSQIQFCGTPSKLLVTPNQQDHGVLGLKAKICSAIPVQRDKTLKSQFQSLTKYIFFCNKDLLGICSHLFQLALMVITGGQYTEPNSLYL